MAVEQMLGGIGMDALIAQIGTGGILGFIAGILSKKITKLIAVIVGGGLLLLKWMESKGMVQVDWGAVMGGVFSASSTAAETAPSLFNTIVSTLGLGGSFVGGFLLGFKKG